MSSSPHVSSYEPRPGEALACGLGSAVVFALAAVLPPLAVLVALPLMVLRLRAGFGAMALGAVVASALLGALFGQAGGLGFLAFVVPPLVMADTLARGRGLIRGCVRAFALMAAQVLGLLAFSGAWMRDLLLDSLAPLKATELLETMAVEERERLLASVATWESILGVVYPAIWLVAAAGLIIGNAAVLRWYLLRRDPGWLDGGEFESLRLPFAVPVVFVLSGAAVALPAARPVAYNVLLMVAFFFALQGLAVVAFYAARLAGPRFLRVAMVILVLVNPWAAQILALLGMFDIWFDFRKWAEPPPPAA